MLLSELKKRRSLILSEVDNLQIVLYPSNKTEVNKLEELLSNISRINLRSVEGFDFLDDINMCGSIKEVAEVHCKDILPITKKRKDKDYETSREKIIFIEEYKCYEQRSSTSNSFHENRLSSFRCACLKIQSEYFIILEEIKQQTIEDGNISQS